MANTQISADELDSLLENAHLRYVDNCEKGYFRKKKGQNYSYVDADGKTIHNEKILSRIKALVLPPAWKDVWICSYSNGHLQATGIDAAGRKQYRYHEKWSSIKNQSKFDGMLSFGLHLTHLRRQLRKDLKLGSLDKQKASALAIAVMDDTFIRVGNTAYEQQYGSYGLTTLKNRHVTIKGRDCFFRFRGKKGVQQKLFLTSKGLAAILRKVKEIPGQDLFQYYDENEEICQLDSGQINEYLKTYMGSDFTCKDFRTWAGTLLALTYIKKEEKNLTTDSKKNTRSNAQTVAILDYVASELGNTRAVSKKYYVHPDLLSIYEKNQLEKIIPHLKYCSPSSLYKTGEKELLHFLKYLQKRK